MADVRSRRDPRLLVSYARASAQRRDALQAATLGRSEWADSHARGFQAIKGAVDSLLADSARVSGMTPLDHFEWAQSLPSDSPEFVLPDVLREHAETWGSLDPAERAQKQREALLFWLHRKQVTEQQWLRQFQALPAHCKGIVGPDKSLVLFKALVRSGRRVGAQCAARAGAVRRRWRAGRGSARRAGAGVFACGQRSGTPGGSPRRCAPGRGVP